MMESELTTTMVDISRGFQARVKEYGGIAFMDIRRYYTAPEGGSLRPGIPGVTLPRESWENFKEVHQQVMDPMGNNIEVDLGRFRALGTYRGGIYMCRYRTYGDQPLNMKRDYIIMNRKMIDSLLTAAPLLDADFGRLATWMTPPHQKP